MTANYDSQSLGKTHLQPFLNSEIPVWGRELTDWKWLPFKRPSFTANTKVVAEPSVSELHHSLSLLLCGMGTLHLDSYLDALALGLLVFYQAL